MFEQLRDGKQQKRDEIEELRNKRNLTSYERMLLRDGESQLQEMTKWDSYRNNGKPVYY